MPAFVVQKEGDGYSFVEDNTVVFGDTLRIYFALSPYTNLAHSKYMHVKIVDQQTNANVINGSASNIKLNCATQTDPNRETEDRYFIELKISDFKVEKLIPFRYYKLQMRSCNEGNIGNISFSQLTNSPEIIYSEWSTVMLIKPILQPLLKLKYFNDDIPNPNKYGIAFASDTLILKGSLTFNQEELLGASVSEYIKEYNVTLKNNNGEIIYQSGTLYPDVTDLKKIDYVVPYSLQDRKSYTLEVFVETTGYYSFTSTYSFFVYCSEAEEHYFTGTYLRKNLNDGTVTIHVAAQSLNDTMPDTILYIRRTDSYSNFTQWEDIYSQMVYGGSQTQTEQNSPEISQGSPPIIEWKDVTVESGVWYEYAIQWISPSTHVRTKNYVITTEQVSPQEYDQYMEQGHAVYKLKTSTVMGQNEDGIILMQEGNPPVERKVMMVFEDSFLVGENGKQLKITYDGTLDSMKYTQYVSKTDTIGSKYPFIRQNTITSYRTFPISGLITYLSDEEGMFIPQKQIYGNDDLYNLYQDYNDKYDINQYNDYIKERKFREAAMQFLISDSVKLYRTTTEGNILVKLMDINFSPKSELGRYLYSFSATAVECGECSITNYSKYKIQKMSEMSYDLLSSNILKPYKTEIVTKEENSFSAQKMTYTTADNIKEKINLLFDQSIDIYEEVENIQQSDNPHDLGYYEKNNEEYILTQDESPVQDKTYYRKTLTYENPNAEFYKIGISFLSNPYPITIGDISFSGWKMILDGRVIYIDSEKTNYYELNGTMENPISFNSLYIEVNQSDDPEVSPAYNTMNIIIDAKLTYTATRYYEKQFISDEVGWDWVEITQQQAESINTIPWYYAGTYKEPVDITWQEGRGNNLVAIAQNKEERKYEANAITVVTTSAYRLKLSDIAKGVVVKAKANNDENYSYYIIGDTSSLNIDNDNNTADDIYKFTEIYIVGYLVSETTALSDKTFADIGGYPASWHGYTVSYYTDLTFLNEAQLDGEKNYGIIEDYIQLEEQGTPNIELFCLVTITPPQESNP